MRVLLDTHEGEFVVTAARIVGRCHKARKERDPSYPRAICQGDSGGSTGMWLDGAFVLYGINSAAWCGAFNNSTSYAAIVTRVRYNMDFIEPALANSNIFCQHGTAGGAAIRYCW